MENVTKQNASQKYWSIQRTINNKHQTKEMYFEETEQLYQCIR